MDKIMLILGLGILALLTILGFSLLFAIPTMLLWNWLMPMLFGFPQIGLLQALGINLLSGLLFKASSSCSCRAS